MLHGFPGNHRGLTDLFKGSKKYRFIIPDLPGCGQSESLKNIYNLKHYAKWLNDFLDDMSLGQVTVIGHSFGARIAIIFSEHYHKRIENMVLITPVVNVEGLIARAASIEYKIAEVLPKGLQKIWLSNRIYQGLAHMIIYKSTKANRREQLIKMDQSVYRLIDPATTISVFEEFYKHRLISSAKKIKTNTLIIAGDKDEIAPLDQVSELIKYLTHSDMVVMKNSGHLLVLERPVATTNIIQRWLESNDKC